MTKRTAWLEIYSYQARQTNCHTAQSFFKNFTFRSGKIVQFCDRQKSTDDIVWIVQLICRMSEYLLTKSTPE